MVKKQWKKCSRSGLSQMLDWFPEGDYPGAVVCSGCSYGVLIRKGTARPATSIAGFEGMAGVVRTHYVSAYGRKYRKPGGVK